MQKKQYTFIIILFFSFSFLRLYAENVGRVYSFESPDSKIIYYGPLLKGESDTMNFVVQSYLADTILTIINRAPTFVLDNSPNSFFDGNDFESFSYGNIINLINNFPISLSENKLIDTIKIPFTAITGESEGRREARLRIGFVYVDDSDTATTTLHIDTFFLIGKNTAKYIDGYDDFVKFDSVFINQANPVMKKFKVKNTYINNINAIEQEWNLISQQSSEQEFFISDATYPLTFYTGNNTVFREWDFGYSPKDLLPDTAEFRIIFRPDENDSNKLDTVIAHLYGIGVMQSFNILRNSNCEISGNIDTIDIGSIRVGTTKTATVSLRNVGNLNYKLVSQNIYDEINDISVDYFKMEIPFCKENLAMKINDIDSFSIAFTPDKKGTFIARYVLENDFKERKILSNNSNDYKKTIILKGVGVEPILQLEKDNIDFGNVSYANDVNCPNQKDTLITLFNIGNSELIINDIKTNNPVFQVVPTDISIPANSSAQIKITFISNSPEDFHTANLVFETNENRPIEKIISLAGKSIPPVNATLSIPHLSVKPGTILEVPIELINAIDNSSVSQYASNFAIHLNYNPALLSYINYITFGTATEGCPVEDNELGNGNLEIRGAKLSSTLDANTTFIKLRFRTFLGDKPTTEIAIINAKVGINEICDDYIKLNLNNGSYSIDSIGGLDYKLNNLGKDKYDFSIVENDFGSIEINFALPFEIDAQLSICNYLGNELFRENYFLPKGNYSKTIPLTNFNSGIYYIIFRSGLYYKIIPLVRG